MMTKEEAKKWYESMPEDQVLQMIIEHHELKQFLCSKTLSVPTGTDDWVNRSIKKARQLRSFERQLRKTLHVMGERIEEAKWETHFDECDNCQGRKRTSDGELCGSCRGSGLNGYGN